MRAWLDADDRVRRLVVALTFADLLAGGPDDTQVPDHVADSPVTFAVELFDFGSHVAIDVPDEDKAPGLAIPLAELFADA